jgi:hypothetical protein
MAGLRRNIFDMIIAFIDGVCVPTYEMIVQNPLILAFIIGVFLIVGISVCKRLLNI